MALTNIQKELIAQSVIKVLYTRFNSFPSDEGNNRNAPFHEAFLKAFTNKLNGRVKNVPDFINLSSWMHGLSTSLGQTFFESVAHILCEGEKRDFKNNSIYTNQMKTISEIMVDLKNGDERPNDVREDFIIRNEAYGEKQLAPNFTVDCFYETDTEVVAIELKAVRPNSGEMRGEKQKILIGKTILRDLFPNKQVRYIFGFPFDPTAHSDTDYNKTRFLKYLVEADKFIAHDDFMIADELWSFLADSNNAMQEILDIINRIATPRFMEKFDKIQDKNTSRHELKELLTEWYQYREVEMLKNPFVTGARIRLYNQSIFKTDGSYNTRRLDLM